MVGVKLQLLSCGQGVPYKVSKKAHRVLFIKFCVGLLTFLNNRNTQFLELSLSLVVMSKSTTMISLRIFH